MLTSAQHAAALDKSIFPGIQGGPMMQTIAAKAVAFGEALQPSFKTYQERVLANARALGEELLRSGVRLVAGGTDTHLLLVDLTPKNLTGKAVEGYLDEIKITVNKNGIPFDPQKAMITSGIRLGTPAITTRGMGTDEARPWAAEEVGVGDVAVAHRAVHDLRRRHVERQVLAAHRHARPLEPEGAEFAARCELYRCARKREARREATGEEEKRVVAHAE